MLFLVGAAIRHVVAFGECPRRWDLLHANTDLGALLRHMQGSSLLSTCCTCELALAQQSLLELVQAFDGDMATKWLAFFDSARSSAAWLEFRLQPGSKPEAVLSYVLTSANDFPERDPGSWVLRGLPADAQADDQGAKL